MNLRSLMLGFLMIIAIVPSIAIAQSIRYVDESGNIFFVDSPSQVPEKYRNQLVEKKPVRISKKDWMRQQKEIQKKEREKEREKKQAEKQKAKDLKRKQRELAKENKERQEGRPGIVKRATPVPTPLPADAVGGTNL